MLEPLLFIAHASSVNRAQVLKILAHRNLRSLATASCLAVRSSCLLLQVRSFFRPLWILCQRVARRSFSRACRPYAVLARSGDSC